MGSPDDVREGRNPGAREADMKEFVVRVTGYYVRGGPECEENPKNS